MKVLNFDDYQRKAKTTATYPKRGKNFIYPAIGLMGEAGEIANKVQKIIRDDNYKLKKEKVEEIKGELGDVLWYVAILADELKLKLSDIVTFNIQKLAKRKTEGKIHGSGDNR